ncbi:MAG: DUF1501 domain-containing protein [Planctomycetaceae bacterium]
MTTPLAAYTSLKNSGLKIAADGTRVALTRRGLLAGTALTFGSSALSNWMQSLAQASDQADGSATKPKRSCLLLWMNGGPTQTDTFDMKPGHAHGGPFQPIATSAPGISISEHLPETAKWMHRLSIVRSMSTREGDHGRARDHLRSGYLPQGPIKFPVLGSLVSHECGSATTDLPHYVSILPRGIFRSGIPPAGFLGTEHGPLLVGNDLGSETGERKLRVDNLALAKGVGEEQARSRWELLKEMEREFLDRRPGLAADGYRSAYDRSLKLMSPDAAMTFDLEREPAEVRDAYGTTPFGQGCLLARRLLEKGVPFVEVTLGGWDTHNDNFTSVEALCDNLDRAWAALLGDLEERGLLDSTLIVWMGEFGRTPVINPQLGRDHYPKAWSAVLGGGGIKGGQVIGSSSDDGLEVTDHPVGVPDLLATICLALGLDPNKQNISNVARPIRLVDPAAKPVKELLG